MQINTFEFIKDIFEVRMPFNKALNLKVIDSGKPVPYIRFDMQEHHVGNYIQNILHGGVISSTLDVMGGMVSLVGIIEKMKGAPEKEMFARMEKMGTIDLRIDYLRPGRGKYFIASGEAMRAGNKVTVTRMELKNDEDLLIAVGTGTYLVG
jgi:uncharacterized protein (TIGR00369 family)